MQILNKFNALIHNVLKWSDTLEKPYSKCWKIFKVCSTVLGRYAFKSWKNIYFSFFTCYYYKVLNRQICPYFRLFGLNTERYGPEITPYLYTFHAVQHIQKCKICTSNGENVRVQFTKNNDCLLSHCSL